MISNNFSRLLSLMLAVLMLIFVLPVPSLAAELTEEEGQSNLELQETELPPVTEAVSGLQPPSEENTTNPDLLDSLQLEINLILEQYHISKEMSEQDINSAVDSMDWDTYQTARWEISQFVESINNSVEKQQLTVEELQNLADKNNIFCFFADALEVKASTDNEVSLLANKTANLFNNAIAVDYNDSYTEHNTSNGTFTATVSGYVFGKSNTTITIKNSTQEEITIAFDYSASNYNLFTIAGVAPSTPNSSFSTKLAGNGGSIALYIQSNNIGTAQLLVNNIKIISESVLTLNYNDSLGSVTVGGQTIANLGTATIPVEGATIVATANTGADFLGWVNISNRSLVSLSESYPLSLDQDITIEAVFVDANSKPYFRVGTSYLFDNLADAITCTTTSGIKTIISVSDGSLAAGDYTIPNDVTFLIPFDSADTISKDDPSSSAMSSTETPSAYRTLKVPSGATITCNGILNVNGQRKTSGQTNTGTAQGKHGKLVLEGSGTQLTMGTTGKLYCYGYITGTGRVELANGSELHELLQMCDWPGGSNASAWTESVSKNSLFLSSRYYVQNIEAPLRVNYGADVYCEAILEVASITITSPTKFLAPSGDKQGLFLMGTGTYIDRSYNPANDRMTYVLGGSGTITFGSIEVEINNVIKGLLALAGYSVDLNSASYTLPLSSAMTVQIEPGVTVNMGNRVALLPGAEVIINGTMDLTSAAYIIDASDWTPEMVFGTQTALPYTVGRGTKATLSLSSSGKLEVNGTLNISGNGGIYTTSGITTKNTTSNSADKIITGTGTIIHNGSTEISVLNTGYNATRYDLTVSNGIANLAGLGEMKPLGTGTYYGLGPDHNNYWYQTDTIEDATCTKEGTITYTCDNATGAGYVVSIPKKDHTEVIDAAVDSTCTSTGLTEGKHCSVCDEVLVAQEEVAKLSHSYSSETTKAPTCTETGVKTFTCTACGDSYTEEIPVNDHSWEDGTVCDVCGIFMIYGTNLKVGDGMDIYFYVGSDVTVENDWKAVFYRDGHEYTELAADSWETTSDGMHRFCYSGIAAKEMTDVVTVTIYDAGGKAISVPFKQSVENYARQALNAYSDNTTLCTALVDMLNYGAAAQVRTGYNTSKLANASLSDEQKVVGDVIVNYNTAKDEEELIYELFGATVNTKAKLHFTFYFDGIDPDNLAQYSAKTSYMTIYNDPVTKMYTGTEFYSMPYTYFDEETQKEVTETYYGPRVIDMSASDGNQIVTCELYVDGELVTTVSSSVESYIANTLSTYNGYIEKGDEKSLAAADEIKPLVDVCKALKKFIDSSSTYFKSVNKVS